MPTELDDVTWVVDSVKHDDNYKPTYYVVKFQHEEDATICKLKFG